MDSGLTKGVMNFESPSEGVSEENLYPRVKRCGSCVELSNSSKERIRTAPRLGMVRENMTGEGRSKMNMGCSIPSTNHRSVRSSAFEDRRSASIEMITGSSLGGEQFA